MSFDPVAAMIAYHAAIDAHDIPTVAKLLALDAVYASSGLGMVRGREAIVAAMTTYFTGHPDHQSWDDEIIATGTFTARSQWKLRATDRLTGNVVKRHGVEDIVFDNNGLILEVNVMDETE